MSWRKLGCLNFDEPADATGFTHAALPIYHDGWLYYSARDSANRAHIFRGRLDLSTCGVSEVSGPLLSPGELGAFDDAGVTTSCIVDFAGRIGLFYTGWMLGRSVPFYFAVGLALSEDAGRTFHRVAQSPCFDRNPVDPLLLASPSVQFAGGQWRMWYVSGLRWAPQADGALRHYYHIRYAESDDARAWRATGRVCVDFAAPHEYAFGRPCVLQHGAGFEMWYCYRAAIEGRAGFAQPVDAYRLGFATSPDGLTWTRRDAEAGLTVSAAGWDSEMIAYPYVFEQDSRRYLLYNGNGYGRTGIGLAVWVPA